MINSKGQLHDILAMEKKHYFKTPRAFLKSRLLHEREYNVWRLQRFVRILEYYASIKHTFWGKVMYFYYALRVYRLRESLGIEIWHSCFGEGLIIYHASGIVVNSKCIIGKNCHLHGSNCIGNNGISDGCPKIGDNCDIGYGASIIGDIVIGNNVRIAAGAIVNKSFEENDILLAGVPAKIVKRYNVIDGCQL